MGSSRKVESRIETHFEPAPTAVTARQGLRSRGGRGRATGRLADADAMAAAQEVQGSLEVLEGEAAGGAAAQAVEDLLRLADGLLEDRAPLAHERVPLGVCQLRRRVRGFPVVLPLPDPAGEARRGRWAQEAKVGQETENAREVYCG